jgi:peptidoglycan L-alanyl-D-glutamate endopeptidase CwlK
MSRRIEDLNPAVAEKCRRFIALCKERGIDVIVTSTLRAEAEQLALFAQGRKALRAVNGLRAAAGLSPITVAQNKIVTKSLTSPHQSGCAFDVVILSSPPNLGGVAEGRGGVPTWDVKVDVNENHIPDYEEIGRIGESIGLRWGGRFKFRDYVHFEYIVPPAHPLNHQGAAPPATPGEKTGPLPGGV